jgi:hypothetical protein
LLRACQITFVVPLQLEGSADWREKKLHSQLQRDIELLNWQKVVHNLNDHVRILLCKILNAGASFGTCNDHLSSKQMLIILHCVPAHVSASLGISTRWCGSNKSNLHHYLC